MGACDNCCSSTENEPLCLCDGCEQESQLANDAAKEAAHAAGYAAAVADVVAWLMSRKYGACSREIEAGAHVGAAKKGAA